jgi:hypothetical protein
VLLLRFVEAARWWVVRSDMIDQANTVDRGSTSVSASNPQYDHLRVGGCVCRVRKEVGKMS